MRGFAALYVVLFHAVQQSKLIPLWYQLFTHGRTMVTIFIAISGFCLMLPVAKNDLILQPGFFRRRAFRILPPYYLILGIAILAEVLSYPRAARMAYIRQPSTTLSLWSHLLMVHNWFPNAQFSFDGPLWSVAMECQIYLLFPLMVVAWRRIGPAATLIVVGILAHLGYHWTGNQVTLNYFFTFALGMLGADLAVRGHGRSLRLIQLASIAGFVGYLLAVHANKVYLSDILVGVFASMFMAAAMLGGMNPLRRLLSDRVIVWFGSFSYSIYLVHSVVQNAYLRTAFAANMATQPFKQMLVFFFGITPLVIVASYLFYIAAERPSIELARKRSS